MDCSIRCSLSNRIARGHLHFVLCTHSGGPTWPHAHSHPHSNNFTTGSQPMASLPVVLRPESGGLIGRIEHLIGERFPIEPERLLVSFRVHVQVGSTHVDVRFEHVGRIRGSLRAWKVFFRTKGGRKGCWKSWRGARNGRTDCEGSERRGRVADPREATGWKSCPRIPDTSSIAKES